MHNNEKNLGKLDLGSEAFLRVKSDQSEPLGSWLKEKETNSSFSFVVKEM